MSPSASSTREPRSPPPGRVSRSACLRAERHRAARRGRTIDEIGMTSSTRRRGPFGLRNCRASKPGCGSAEPAECVGLRTSHDIRDVKTEDLLRRG